jgi:hypothetical protein
MVQMKIHLTEGLNSSINHAHQLTLTLKFQINYVLFLTRAADLQWLRNLSKLKIMSELLI